MKYNPKETSDAVARALEIYKIEVDGSIANRETGKSIRGSIQKNYRTLDVWVPTLSKKKRVLAHRVIATKFVPNPLNLPLVNHKDGDTFNNHPSNLEWCTASYNVQDGFNRGRVVWNEGKVKKSHIINFGKRYPRQLLWFLTTDECRVAKAIWPGEKTWLLTDLGEWIPPQDYDGHTLGSITLLPWQYHLQQIILTKNHLQYIEENVDGS